MKPKFRSALISVSDACRVACRHCFRADKGTTDLTLEVLERTLSRLREVGLERLCFTGGEPLDHPELDKLIRKTIQFGVSVSIITGRAATLANQALPDWLQRVESIGLSFDSEFLVTAGVSTRKLEEAVAAAHKIRNGTRAYLHGTCFNLSVEELSFFRKITCSGVELNVSPAQLEERLRERLGYSATSYSAQLASDLRLIEEISGTTNRLSAKYCQLAVAHMINPRRPCRASRLYVSSDGYIRICPYDRIGQVSVFAPRSKIHQTLESAILTPPVVAFGCIGTCGLPS